jgi:hypothetical protein
MAYVPDNAMRRKRQISRSAWDVYEQLCAFGDADAGIVEARFVSNSRLVEETGLALGTVKNALTELRKKGWIEERRGRVFLLVGTFLNELRRRKKVSSASDAPSPYGDASSSVSDAPSPVSDGDRNRTRAWSDQPLNQPVNQHTHQPAAVAESPLATEAPAARVGVSPDVRSKFSRPELWRYANANGLGGGWVTEAQRTTEWDYDVGVFLESGGQHVSGSVPKRGFDAVLDKLQGSGDGTAPKASTAGVNPEA